MNVFTSILAGLALAFQRLIFSASLGAKTGAITAPTGADPVIKSLGDTTHPANTLAGIMRDAFGAAALTKRAIINLANRTVTIVPSGTSLAALDDDLTPIALFTKDDATKGSSPFSDSLAEGSDGALAVVAVTAAAKPSMSVESLVNRLEDVLTDPAAAILANGNSALIVVDQAAGTIQVLEGTVAEIEGAQADAAMAEDAHFVQTLTGPAGTQFGE